MVFMTSMPLEANIEELPSLTGRSNASFSFSQTADAAAASSQLTPMFKGKNGHIAIRTNSVELAVAELAKKGFAYDESSAKYKNGRMTVAYLKDEFGGFAVHLLQK